MKVEEIRSAAGVTQQQMAIELLVAIRTVANWEANEKTLDDLSPLMRAQVERFARKHKVSIGG